MAIRAPDLHRLAEHMGITLRRHNGAAPESQNRPPPTRGRGRTKTVGVRWAGCG